MNSNNYNLLIWRSVLRHRKKQSSALRKQELSFMKLLFVRWQQTGRTNGCVKKITTFGKVLSNQIEKDEHTKKDTERTSRISERLLS